MEFKKQNKNGGTYTIYRSFVDSCYFTYRAYSYTSDVETHTRQKSTPFWPLWCKSKAILSNKSRLRRSWQLGQPGFSYVHENFYKEKSDEARSWKPSQPGLPGYYEEARRLGILTSFMVVIFFVLTWWIVNEFEKLLTFNTWLINLIIAVVGILLEQF